MKSFVIRFKKGDELIAGILDFCQKKKITGAWFSGLGATNEVDLAIYDLDQKKYIRKNFSGIFEISSLSGNLARINSKFIIHCHAVLTDEKFRAFGGHVDKLIVAATCEIRLQEFDFNLNRKYSDEIGLNLLDL